GGRGDGKLRFPHQPPLAAQQRSQAGCRSGRGRASRHDEESSRRPVQRQAELRRAGLTTRFRSRGRSPAATITVAGLIKEGERRLRAARLAFGHGSLGPRDEAACLALSALKLPFDAPDRVLSRPVNPDKAEKARKLFSRRIRERRPAAYLTRE